MAYCVHCGVKLGDAEKSCPLCGTEVHDPAGTRAEDAPKPFPVHTPEQRLSINRRYAVTLLSMLLLLPAGACILLDIIGQQGISWSIYPAGVLVLIWIAVTVPIVVRSHRLSIAVWVTGGTVCAYLWLVAFMTDGKWFWPVVCPAVLLFTCMVWFTALIIRGKRLRLLRLTAFIVAEIGILCTVIELLCVLQGIGGNRLTWSPFVILPCAILALLLYAVSRNRTLSTQLKRRLHF